MRLILRFDGKKIWYGDWKPPAFSMADFSFFLKTTRPVESKLALLYRPKKSVLLQVKRDIKGTDKLLKGIDRPH